VVAEYTGAELLWAKVEEDREDEVVPSGLTSVDEGEVASEEDGRGTAEVAE
jgi:hypothetical protein